MAPVAASAAGVDTAAAPDARRCRQYAGPEYRRPPLLPHAHARSLALEGVSML
ncbi:hypothetical protein HF329_23950 [Chitinophaga oryzae]|uniref:Uncharacterized protein n=1 Tax=Chitinophaga oryzae TaxID=2725414 RepID=A0AAE6ZJ49_9BACT|nr:hypothetical protein [Chitinophaga oryzae]QJB34176.1 hypothetical protein HF329_23950 [Chitinophaga oryzae]